MQIKCFCPHCGQMFTMEAPEGAQVEGAAGEAPKRRNVSEEERAKRAERMRALRAQGIGGRPKGAKNRAPRSDAGKARGARDV